jgi:hypothetical protein
MVHLTTFILFTQIARAFPEAYGGRTSPELFTPDPYGDTEFNFEISSLMDSGN